MTWPEAFFYSVLAIVSIPTVAGIFVIAALAISERKRDR